MTNEEYLLHLQYIDEELYELLQDSEIDEAFDIIIKDRFPGAYDSVSEQLFSHSLSQTKLTELDTLIHSVPPTQTLGEYILSLVNQRNFIKDSDVYTPALIRREQWHKIIHGKIKKTSMDHLFRIASALKLSDKEMLQLLSKGGYSTDELNNKRGILITFCFREHVYDLRDIEEFLLKYNLPSICPTEN